MATLGQSLLGTMRLNRNRINYYTPNAYVYTNAFVLSSSLGRMRLGRSRLNHYAIGVDVPTISRMGPTIKEVVNSTPNKMSMRISGVAPLEGADIKLYVGTTAPGSLLFAGNIQTFTQVPEGKGANVAYDLSCNDYTSLFDRKYVYATFTDTSVSTIIASVISSFSDGFTTHNVEPGLPNRSFTWNGQPLSQVMTEICQSVSARWKVDYLKDVHARTGVLGFPVPDTAVGDKEFLAGFTAGKDITQVRNRVIVIYKGSTALVPVAAGFSTIPIKDATTFDTAGGTFITSFAQKLPYTGKSTNDRLGSTVGGILYAPSAPTATVNVSTSGKPLGTYTYKVSYVIGDGLGATLGESDLSVASNTVVATTVAAPTAPTAAVRTGGAISVSSISRSGSTATVTTGSAHLYTTGDIVTMAGADQPEYNGNFTATVTGGSTFTYPVQGSPATPATTATSLTASVTSGGSIPVGTYTYKATFVSASGETLGSTASSSATVSAVSVPSAPSTIIRTGGPAEITSITRSLQVATVTLAVTSARYVVGDIITISGLAQPEYNGTFAVVANAGTFTFIITIVGSPVSPATTLIGGSSPPYPSGTAKAFLDISGNIGGSNITPQVTYTITYVTSAGETQGGTSSPLTVPSVTIPGAGVAAQSSGVSGGMLAGAYIYRVAYGTTQGETVITTATNFTGASTISAVAAPISLVATVTSGVSGNLTGTFDYYLSYVTSSGETTATVPLAGAGISAISSPGAPTVNLTSGVSGALTTGAYLYKVAFTTSNGETVPGSSGTVTVAVVTPPFATGMGTAVVSATPGSLRNGTYSYSLTYRTSAGETVGATGSIPTAAITQISNSATSITSTVQYVSGTGALTGQSLNYLITDIDGFDPVLGETTGAATGTITMGGGNDANIVKIAASSDARSLYRRLYRRNNGDGLGYLLLGDIAKGAFWYYDTFLDTSRTSVAPPGSNTTGNGQIAITSIPTSGDARVTARVIYRKLGAGAYKQLAVLGDNTSTSYNDNIAESATTGIPIPSSDSTGFAQVSLTAIPTSGDARVTGRAIYRTKVGGSVYFSLSRIGDNSTTAYTDNTPDTSLGTGTAPLAASTADNGQVDLSSIGTSGDGRVTGRSVYRSKAGTVSPAYLVTTINDNVTTTYRDNTPDTSLGIAAPTVTQANTGQMSLTSIPLSSDQRVISRVLYRTKAGGTVFYKLAIIPDNIVAIYTDTTPDTSLTEQASSVDTSGGSQIRVYSIPVSSDSRVIARRIYRLPSLTPLGTAPKLVATLSDNTTTTYLDNVAEANLGPSLSTVDTSGGGQIRISSLQVSGDARVIGRDLYRENGDGFYHLVQRVQDNTSTTVIDNSSDNTGVLVPGQDPARLTSTFGGNTITLTTIPLGPAGTTARKIYRTKDGGTLYFYQSTLDGNVSQTLIDNDADSDLGNDAPLLSSVATVAGSTTLSAVDTTYFSSTGGWVLAGSQVISYTGKSTTSGSGALTGIPATGTGAIAANLRAGTDLINAPFLTGVSGLTIALPDGDIIRPMVQGDNAASQRLMGSREGGDGVHETKIDDDTIVSLTAATAAYQAEFSLFALSEQKVTLQTRDYKASPGATMTIAIPAPTNLSVSVPIMAVTISDIGVLTGPLRYPLRSVELSTTQFTLQDFLKKIALSTT